MTQPIVHPLKAAGPVTAPGAGEALTIGIERSVAAVTVDVTELPAETALTLRFETALTPAAGFVELDDAVIDKVGPHQVLLSRVQQVLRVLWDVPAQVDFTVTATSEQVYCNTTDLSQLSLPASTLAKLSEEDRARACVAGTDEAASYLGAYFELPLIKWGHALRMHSANMAAYHAMKRRGFNPDADATIRLGYTDAIAWLTRTAKNDPTIVDSNVAIKPTGGYVTSEAPRGWQRH